MLQGHLKVGDLWRASNLQWGDFLSADENISQFIKTNVSNKIKASAEIYTYLMYILFQLCGFPRTYMVIYWTLDLKWTFPFLGLDFQVYSNVLDLNWWFIDLHIIALFLIWHLLFAET